MKVINIHKFYYLKGGAERHFFELQKLLKKNKHTVIPFAMQDKKNLVTKYSKYFVSYVPTQKIEYTWNGIRTIFRFLWSFEARRKLKKLIKNEKPDLAIIHSIQHQISPSILPVIKKSDIPIFMFVHDFALISPSANMLVNNKIYDKIMGSKYYLCLKDKCIKNSFWASLLCVLEMYLHHKVLNIYQKNIDIFIAPSQFVANKLIQASFDKNKIKVLPNFVDISQAHKVSTTSSNEKYILYFGRLAREKGMDILIKAIQQLPQVKLKIVGQGPEKENYIAQIKKGDIKNIEIVGHRSGKELASLIRNSQFVIIPSICYENCPLSILEAMALGKPIIASDLGGIPEIVIHQKNGLIFKKGNINQLADKIKSLWFDQKLIDKLSEQALKSIQQNHDSQIYYKKIMQIYKTCV